MVTGGSDGSIQKIGIESKICAGVGKETTNESPCFMQAWWE
jgi:hypothetical protein